MESQKFACVSEELNSVETLTEAFLYKTLATVSEELNSVETEK